VNKLISTKYVSIDETKGLVLSQPPLWNNIPNNMKSYYLEIASDFYDKYRSNRITPEETKYYIAAAYDLSALTFLENIFPLVHEDLKTQGQTTITQKSFGMSLRNYIVTDKLSSETIKNYMSVFLLIYGDSESKLIAKSELSKKTTNLDIYKAPLSEKYQVPDVSNIIYAGITPLKLKTLFTECKQALLLEYNETREKKSKKDKEVAPTAGKIVSYTPETNVIQFNVNELKNPLFKTTAFYSTKDNANYFKVVPNETKDNLITGTIYTDKKDTGLNAGDRIQAAETFGAKYDIQAEPAENRDSNFWKKLKKSMDVVGLSGDQSIFKTAAGETVSNLAGGLNTLRKEWVKDTRWLKMFNDTIFPWEKEMSAQDIKSGFDAHVRWCIFMMFNDYLDFKLNRINLGGARNMNNIVPILADHFKEYDGFVRWFLETTNYVLAELLNEFPEQKRTADLLRQYCSKRGFFAGTDKPKGVEIVGIAEKKVADDFVKYCKATRIVS
jgi:hypothetical protein